MVRPTAPAFATPEGNHPMDAQAEASGLLGWLVEAILLAFRQWTVVFPFALILGVLAILMPHLSFADRGSNFFVRFLDAWLTGSLSAAVILGGFAVLARREGLPHAVGELQPLGKVIPRVLLLLVVALLLVQGIAYLFGELLRLLVGARPIAELVGWTFRTFGAWALAFWFWLFSPLLVIAWVFFQLSQILSVRSDLSVLDSLRAAASEVFSQLGRLVIPGWIVVAFLILLARALAYPTVLLALNAGPWLIGFLIALVAGLIIIPLCFVLERAYVPWSGRSEAVDDEPRPPPPTDDRPLRSIGQPAPASSTVNVLDQVRTVLSSQGPGAAAEAACTAIRLRQRPREEVTALLDVVGDWAALAKPLSALTAECIRNNRGFESVWLTEYGLARDPAFLTDQPDQLVPFAKRLTQTERPDLAQKLLILFVRQHPQHPQFLNGGLLLARLLMSHGNNPAAARKLLNHLKPLFPTELQIDQLLRQLG